MVGQTTDEISLEPGNQTFKWINGGYDVFENTVSCDVKSVIMKG